MHEEDTTISVAELAEWRQQHIGRLFLQLHRDFSARTVEKLRARGHGDLTLTHTTLLPHIDVGGIRSTVLAERAGITKQAAGQIIADLERLGYVKRVPDAADRRATLIGFTPLGWRFLRDAYAIKRDMEAEYAVVLGETGLEALREALNALLRASPRADPR